MNKKGFTLVEILAVIIILALIMVVVSTNGFGAFDKTKNKLTDLNKKAIVEAANILVLDINNCDDDLDQDLITSLEITDMDGDNDKDCEDLHNTLTSGGVQTDIEFLIEESYVTGKDINKFDSSMRIIIEKDFNGNITVKDSNGSPFNENSILENTCEAYNETKKGTLACAIMSNDKIKKNNTTPNFNNVATEEEGVYAAEDDYGTSWYFRGAQHNNYVSFAGFTWRIVRINGDGSVRLILDGTLDKVSACDDTTICKPTVFNSSASDNAYIGYMYGFIGGVSNKCLTKDAINKYTVDSSEIYTTKETCESVGGRWAETPYETTHINKNSSTIKTIIDRFYETYIENGTTKQYEKYLADTIFCGDKSLASSGIGGVTTQLGYGRGYSNKTYYAVTDRLWYSTGTTSITNAFPTLKCAEEESNTYSRYTVNGKNTTKGIETNGDLKHPIALLSADELVLAGSFQNVNNESYYLSDAYVNGTINTLWWLLTPSFFNGSNAYEFYSAAASGRFTYSHNVAARYHVDNSGVRPVINLRSDVQIESGEGTSGSPYTIKLS